jgi:hypothetical protein
MPRQKKMKKERKKNKEKKHFIQLLCHGRAKGA